MPLKSFLISWAMALALCVPSHGGKDDRQDDYQDNPHAPLTKRRPILNLEKLKEEACRLIFSEAFRESSWGQNEVLKEFYTRSFTYSNWDEWRTWNDHNMNMTDNPVYKQLKIFLEKNRFSKDVQAILLFEGPPDLFWSLKKSYEKVLQSIPSSSGMTPRWAHLEKLDLSGMALVVFPRQLTTCNNLTYLDLSNNNLPQMPDIDLPYWPSLKILSLAKNLLGTLPKAARHWTNLRRLDLSKNRLQSLPGVGDQWKKLKFISLAKNQIAFLPEGARAWGETLERLDLHENNLKELPPFLEKFPRLEIMNVSQNKLVFFTAPPSLRILKMTETELKVEALGDVSRFTRLEVFNGQGNNFSSIPQGLESLKHLVTLDVDCSGKGEDATFLKNLGWNPERHAAKFIMSLRQHRELQRTKAQNASLKQQLKQLQQRLHDLEKQVKPQE